MPRKNGEKKGNPGNRGNGQHAAAKTGHSWFLPREEKDAHFLLRRAAADLFFGEAKLNFMSSGNNKLVNAEGERESLRDDNFTV